MPMISYQCSVCGCQEEHFHHRSSDAPESIQCRSVNLSETKGPKVEHRIVNPDGTETIEYLTVENVPTMTVCPGTLTVRDSWLDSSFSRPARPFEPLVLYQSVVDPTKFSVPGRNNEPTDAGYRRVEITSMHQYHKLAKSINNIERSKMSDHREMHKTYWDARRHALRDDVNARIRHDQGLVNLASLVRRRSDNKSNRRYGKALEPNFHSQLLEFNQGNMQDFCAEDTGWKSTRAR